MSFILGFQTKYIMKHKLQNFRTKLVESKGNEGFAHPILFKVKFIHCVDTANLSLALSSTAIDLRIPRRRIVEN